MPAFLIFWTGCTTPSGPVAAKTTAPDSTFRWVGENGDDLFDGDRHVLRYMHAYDASTPETLHETYKCYHHVYDETGQNMLTKGSGGLYTHHRGLFVGWNRLAVNDKEYDFWHMKETTQRHVETVTLEADAVRAMQVVRIDWCDAEGDVVLSESRQITVHRMNGPGILLLDFESQLTPVMGDVLLNGDPEHAGFQYRPHNDVADGGAEVKANYLFNEDGIDPHEDTDLPWAAMSYGLNGRRYQVQHMNHPENPKGTLYSAYRDYGRFGAFSKVQVDRGDTLTLRYRVLVRQGGLPARKECEKNYLDYVGVR